MAKGKGKTAPRRMCVSCREMKERQELFRVVAEDGLIYFDEKGKRMGRGAYVCKSSECISRALKQAAMQRHLKASLADKTAHDLELALAESRKQTSETTNARRVFRIDCTGHGRRVDEQ